MYASAGADLGILQGGVQGPRQVKSVGIFKLTSKINLAGGGGGKLPNPLDPPLVLLLSVG